LPGSVDAWRISIELPKSVACYFILADTFSMTNEKISIAALEK